ncbi:phenylalanine--tRNA ligase subunit beta [Candidatus Micrarchaeota archaeon]|nr:phenylalanine--tRNA ligase subunit beta [Candidatus Micrarchaeota archaeon]
MAVVEIPYNEFRKFVNLPKERLVEVLNELGAPAEEREDGLIVAEITPNRPDWFFITGLARSVLSYIGKKKGLQKYATEKSKYVVIVDKSVEKIRPYSACAVVKGLKLNDELVEQLIQFQDKLITTLGRRVKKFGMGFFDLNLMKFPIYYTAKKPEEIVYKPLNYPKVASAKEILEKHPKGIENGYLLDGCDKYPVYLDVDGKVLVLIPIVNSEELGKIGATTSDLFIEVTGNDFETISGVLKVVCCALQDLGGKIYSVEMKYPDKKVVVPDLSGRFVELDGEGVNKVLGTELTKSQVKDFLLRMGYDFDGKRVEAPPYRLDIIHPVDIIEDIAIAHGYDKFKPSLPNFFSPGKEISTYGQIDGSMRGFGFREIKTFFLVNRKEAKKFGFAGLEEVLNPASEECTALRPILVISLLEVFRNNKTKGIPRRY